MLSSEVTPGSEEVGLGEFDDDLLGPGPVCGAAIEEIECECGAGDDLRVDVHVDLPRARARLR